MPQSAFPDGDDLSLYITSLGIIEPANLPTALNLMLVDVKASAAASDFDKRTGWKPFITQTQTRYFDPPGPNTAGFLRGGSRFLDIRAGLLSVTQLTTGFFDGGPTGTSILHENQDFFLWPTTAPQEGRPYEGIDFLVPQWGNPRSMVIEGVWGYSATVPDDVWESVLQYGAALCYQELSLQISRGIYSYKDLNTEIRYAGSKMAPLDLEVQRWRQDYLAKTRQYKRVSV